MEGIDIAEGALAVARRLNEGLPVTYRRHDLDLERLPRRRYDIIFSSGTLHHVCDLEFCVGELHAALMEGAVRVRRVQGAGEVPVDECST